MCSSHIHLVGWHSTEAASFFVYHYTTTYYGGFIAGDRSSEIMLEIRVQKEQLDCTHFVMMEAI